MNKLKKLFENKKVKITTIVVISLLAIYIGISIYFINNFNIGSFINGIDVSGKSVDEVEKIIADKVQDYSLELKYRGGGNEEIKGKAIGIKHVSNGKIKQKLESQNAFLWIVGLFKDSKYSIGDETTYNKESLSNIVDNLSCLKGDNIEEPRSATVKYDSGSYKIVDEVQGNKVNKEKLLSSINKALENNTSVLDLEKSNCYEKPKYTKSSQEIVECLKNVNNQIKTNITYAFGDKSIQVNKDIINTWIEVDNELNSTINSNKVEIYVDQIASLFNTYGNSRTIKNSSGNTITISKGDYGWIVDKPSMIQDIISLVKDGQTVTKEPIFSQRAVSYGVNDYGNSYVEIDLASQHLWLYIEGKCILESDIVSGCVQDGNATPDGVYVLKYKELNATLRGEGYATLVAFWMPFNGGIGLHDATWRDVFGGEEYIYSGSHGCINLPYDVAQIIYNNVNSGFPIVCYYDYNAANTRKAEKEKQAEEAKDDTAKNQ